MNQNLSESAMRALRQAVLHSCQSLHQQIMAIIVDTPCFQQSTLMLAALDSTLEQAQALLHHYVAGNAMGMSAQHHDTLLRLERAVRDDIRTVAAIQKRYVSNISGG